MPVEIKELIIRINVNESLQNNGSSDSVSIEEIVQESIEQISDQLKKQKER